MERRDPQPDVAIEPTRGETESQDLTAAHLSKLIFQSYRFSQGSSQLQRHFFEYLHSIHPDWRVSKDMQTKVEQELYEAIPQYLHGKHAATTGGQIEVSISAELEGAKKIFEGPQKETKERDELITMLASLIIASDYKYLLGTVRQGPGRPRSGQEGKKVTPMNDRFLSHFCYYGLERHSTGVVEFDRMFQEIIELTKQNPMALGAETYGELLGVIDRYNEHHPDSLVELPRKNLDS